MTKQELIERLSTKMECDVEEAATKFDQCIAVLTELFMAGEELTIPAFGRFYVHHRPERMAFDPKRHIKTLVPPKAVPMFRAGDALRMRVNNELSPRQR